MAVHIGQIDKNKNSKTNTIHGVDIKETPVEETPVVTPASTQTITITPEEELEARMVETKLWFFTNRITSFPVFKEVWIESLLSLLIGIKKDDQDLELIYRQMIYVNNFRYQIDKEVHGKFRQLIKHFKSLSLEDKEEMLNVIELSIHTVCKETYDVLDHDPVMRWLLIPDDGRQQLSEEDKVIEELNHMIDNDLINLATETEDIIPQLQSQVNDELSYVSNNNSSDNESSNTLMYIALALLGGYAIYRAYDHFYGSGYAEGDMVIISGSDINTSAFGTLSF